MSAAARILIAVGGKGGSGKPKPKRPNAVRRIMDREQSRERRVRESSVAAASVAATTTKGPAKKSSRLQCANKTCSDPNVVDGTCQTCGRVADDSNIVSEITFGETSNGAAVVQGSYLAADQGGVRSVGGLAFRRVAGGGASEARERSLREAKQLLNQFAQQLRISQNVADSAYRFYRMASNNNFVQGRRKNNVAAICLYAACRKSDNNRVMLIDLADLVKTDVFLLGRGYKEFLNQFPDTREGTKPIILEDLIFRFASKLEFYHDTNKVAESAVRIAARMRHDNITHGRRPAGICGAAIIMAARAHNYRRTVREVVYIAKVTMTTLQERMEEFANVPSAQLTISEFQNNEFLGPAHDPPFVYKSTKEWQEKHNRTRKRKSQARSPDGDSQQASQGAQDQHADKRTRIESSEGQQSQSANPTVVPAASATAPTPVPTPTRVIEPSDDTVLAATADMDTQLEVLASEYGDSESEDDDIDPSSEMAMAAAQGIEVPGLGKKTKPAGVKNGAKGKEGAKKTRRNKKDVVMPINEEWEMDEANLEQEMEGHLNDPALLGASEVVTKAIEERRVQETEAASGAEGTPATGTTGEESAAAPANAEPEPEEPSGPFCTPRSKVSDDPIIHEDEFKDDPEVEYCKLGDAEVKIKEQIWANHNKDYMRKVQQKIFNSKMSQNGPAKQKRTRTKKPRIGEGQASPAGSAEEAAVNMMRARAISTKLDYSRLGQVFDLSNTGPGSTYGGTSSVGSRSALASTATSDAGSENGGDDGDNSPPDNRLRSPSPPVSETATTAPSTIPASVATQAALAGEVEEQEASDDEFGNASGVYGGDGGNRDGYEDETFVEEDVDPFADDDNNNEDDGYGGDEMDED
ncbi:transcription factor iiib-like protein [Apodospora peruviana]|uniref:Transcription factor iiib-like protein n=1 Tax=Apodospora peruviana TaxID=516989 RepID=A0AAE0I5F4_9PEZI|nr:transcription factor iiib-like protein [Apodospora peruviana]